MKQNKYIFATHNTQAERERATGFRLDKLGQHIAYNGLDGLNCTYLYSIIHANAREPR